MKIFYTFLQIQGNFLGVQGRATQIQSVTKPPQSPTQIYPRLSNFESGQKQISLGTDSKPLIGRNHLDKVL